jgi:hypothetical protein
MNTLHALQPPGFGAWRAALHRPAWLAPRAQATVAQPAPQAGWLERLALWSDRQPVHHRLGSYTRYGII